MTEGQVRESVSIGTRARLPPPEAPELCLCELWLSVPCSLWSPALSLCLRPILTARMFAIGLHSTKEDIRVQSKMQPAQPQSRLDGSLPDLLESQPWLGTSFWRPSQHGLTSPRVSDCDRHQPRHKTQHQNLRPFFFFLKKYNRIFSSNCTLPSS